VAQEGGPRAHQVISDTRKSGTVLIPDLGCDRLQILNCNHASGCTASSAIPVSSGQPGAGPRHAVFWTGSDTSKSEAPLLFVANEYSNMIEGYKVTYEGDDMQLKPVSSTNAAQSPIKPGYTAAEIALSVSIQKINSCIPLPIQTSKLKFSISPCEQPDHRFITVSNRNNSLATVLLSSYTPPSAAGSANNNANNSTKFPSDTLVTFAPQQDGSLEPVQVWPAGGMSPRVFSFNGDGTMIAVGTATRLVVMDRNPETGRLGQILATYPFDLAVTSIAWFEEGVTEAERDPVFIGESNVYFVG
jgi:6-phosphogluconolactonase (cycloisomerase 2 family)